MSKVTADKLTLPTTAKVFLNDWATLRNIISIHTTRIKDAADTDKPQPNPATTLFNDREINDALNGPYQKFIKQKMSAYATLAKVRFKLTVQHDENLKKSENSTEKEEAQPELAEFLNKFSNNDLDKMQNELDALTNSHHEAWQAQRAEWKKRLALDINQQGLSLTDLEVKELEDEEPLSELLDRFTDLKLALPKKTENADNFSNYYTLKAKLAIFSALARQHKPHTDQDIEPIIKKLKNTFEAVHNAEKHLIQAQNLETLEIIKPIAEINTLLH